MKSNEKSEAGSDNKANIKKSNPSIPDSPTTIIDKSKNKGEEFIGEGHGHNYNIPVAGEDGGTEDQSESQSKKSKKHSDKNQHTAQGKTAGEKPSI